MREPTGSQPRSGVLSDRSEREVARAAQGELVQRLELLATVSASLAPALDDIEPALDRVAEACVPALCDLFAVELLDENGQVGVVAYRVAAGSGLAVRDQWVPRARLAAPDGRSMLGWGGPEDPPGVAALREEIDAGSLIVAPMRAGGLLLGWLVLATGHRRRGFRASGLGFAEQLAARLSTAVQRVLIYREAHTAVREQEQAVRRLRRLAGAAASLAGAASPSSVLRAACVEACILAEVPGAAVRWRRASGEELTAGAGYVPEAVAFEAFASPLRGRPVHGAGWAAWPLPCSDPDEDATLVLVVPGEVGRDLQVALDSLASLIPVAFERAVGAQEVSLQEVRLRSVLDASPVAFFALPEEGTVADPNGSAIQLFSWKPAGPWPLPEDIADQLLEIAGEAQRGGAVANRSVTSERFDLAVSAWRRQMADAPSAVALAISDLSERRRAERALIRAQRFEAMGQVSGQVAHDFNNLLTVITGYTALLQDVTTQPGSRDMLAKIDGAAQRAAALTRRMLGLSRPQQVSSVVLDLREAVASLAEVLEQVAGRAVALSLVLPDQPLPVRGDPVEIEQIVLNLAINACDAMGHDGTLTIAVDVLAVEQGRHNAGLDPGSYAVLSVADSGPGMTPEVLARCTEPFFTTKGRRDGSGLGLSTVYGLAHERGGGLTISSDPGEGTVVEVWLPLAGETTTGGDAPAPPSARRIEGRAAVVAPDDAERHLAARALKDIGLEVVTAASAEDLQSQLAPGTSVDLLVTGVGLPGMSGPDLARQLAATDPSVRVVLTSAVSDRSDVAGRVPGSRVLLTPFHPADLQEVAVSLRGKAQGSKR